jgi:hypothetical protein
VVHGFIKPRPSVSGSVAQIKNVKGYPIDLIFTVDHGANGGPVSRSSPTSSSWPPLASRLVKWLQSMMNSLNLVAARVRRVSSFAGKNPRYGVRYL